MHGFRLVVALLGIFIYETAQSGVFAFVDQLGIRAGIDKYARGDALSVTGFVGVDNSLSYALGNVKVDLGFETDQTVQTRVYGRVAQSGDSGSDVVVDLGSRKKMSVIIAAYSGTDSTNPVAALASVVPDFGSVALDLALAGRWMSTTLSSGPSGPNCTTSSRLSGSSCPATC